MRILERREDRSEGEGGNIGKRSGRGMIEEKRKERGKEEE